VHTAAQYRKMAEECFQWAATALNDEVRVNYLSSAQVWLQAASRLDGGLPTRAAVIPLPKQCDGKLNEPEPSQAKPSQAKPSQAKPSQANPPQLGD
jgi:hypothetical protein